MTEQEAIEILTLDDEMKSKLPNLKEVYEVAVKALEKQLPKKPQFYATNFYCPCCKNLVGNSDFGWKHNYCERCGQAIDWSDTK